MASCSTSGKATAQSAATKIPLESGPFYTNCACCQKNFVTLKTALLTFSKLEERNHNEAFNHRIMVYSRPETLDCQDCEKGVKQRYSDLISSMYTIKKDHEGFINLYCLPQAAMWLLKGTAVMTHLIPAELQVNIKLRI